MEPSARRLHVFLSDARVNLLVSLATILSFFGWVYGTFQLTGGSFLRFLLFLVLAPFLATTVIYSIRVRQENRAFRHVPTILHRINHNYRDVLSKLFGHGAAGNLTLRMRLEREALVSVCQSISEIFTLLTHVPCTVTVKLITRENGRVYCQTAIRSQVGSERDHGPHRKFELMTGENTAFDVALRYTPGEISYFFSPDLRKEHNYRNQRKNWAAFYRSAIVVPIRYVDWENAGKDAASDLIGFLAVDTLSTNRLNNTFHVALIASFSDQMYNFMSLMRGKYAIPTKVKRAYGH
jgi:hypothetical protein